MDLRQAASYAQVKNSTMKCILKYSVLITLIFNHVVLLADNTDSLRQNKKHHFGFEIGLQNRVYFGNNYIRPYCDTTIPREVRIPVTEYYGFQYDNNLSWHLGFLYYFNVTKWLSLNTGIELGNRRTILSGQSDTIMKYQSQNPIKKYVFNDLTFEVPVFVEFTVKKFNIDVGGNFLTFRVKNNVNYMLDGSKHKNQRKSWERNIFCPAIKISYDFLIKNRLCIRPYLGVDHSYDAAVNTSAKTFDFKLGIALKY
jgi:hypothetical protein